jgi:hypothetical protein
MLDVGIRCRASIRSLGVSPIRLWLASKMGQDLDGEVVGDLRVRYVEWRGEVYTIVKNCSQ